MMYGIAFTMWFLGTEGHITKGDTYKTEIECQKAADAFNTGVRVWLIQAMCVKSGI